MINRFLHNRPLLISLVLIIIGIVIGRYGEVSYHSWGIATLVLLVTVALPWRHGWWWTVPAVPMLVCLGAFLITINDARNPPLPYWQQETATPLSEWAEKERGMLRTAYVESGMRSDELAIAAAMTLGERDGISKETKEVYSITGAAHVFALSGMHLSIIFGLLMWLARPLRWLVFMGYFWRKLIPMMLVLTAIWGYVILVGGHASVLRAAVMISLYCICKVSTRRVKNIDVLILAITVLLVCKPQWLFSISFQMSAMAMVGIVMLMRPIYDLWEPKWWLVRKAWGLFVLSLTAQVGVAPLIAYYFHRFSCCGLLTTFIVSPAAIAIITLALAIIVMTFLHPYVGDIAQQGTQLCGKMLARIIEGQGMVLEEFAALPYSHLDGINISIGQLAVIYVIIVAVGMEVYLLRQNYKRTIFI